ncbi:MAG TPA: tRNA pseudouridine(13) synthase TruD [Geobacteraceae bacterium]|nr:tRNA pseudouridine(13) synthase TruD [Geobacteraceae bacterium]
MHKYLTADIPGTGGVIKETPEDFLVAEIPLYPPCGEGEHTFAEIEKRGITTLEALRRIARAVYLPEREIGYAGMKDARGVTRQTFSIPRISPELLLALELPGIRIISAAPHRNKLKLGHLSGNRFRIWIRGVGAEAKEKTEKVLSILNKRGVPNYFGEQRYGAQGNSHLIGRALLRREYREAVDAIMGDPAQVRDERWQAAIEAYLRGDPGESLRLFPGYCRTERAILQRLEKCPDAWEKAFQAVHPRLKALYLSAFQSALFDRLLDERLASFDRVMTGDLAWKHDNGACFLVEDVAREAERAERFEISPSGPMFGSKMKLPAGEPLALEEALLKAEGLARTDFNLTGGLRLEGERRPLRVPLGEAQLQQDDTGVLLEFSLPKGAYATSVLREIMKTG